MLLLFPALQITTKQGRRLEFACSLVWLWNLVSYIMGRMWAAEFRQQGVGTNT